MASITTTTTSTVPNLLKRQRKKENWEKEFYKNGYPTEVIVIEDSPTPPPPQQQQQTHYDYTYNGSSPSSNNNTRYYDTHSKHIVQPSLSFNSLPRTPLFSTGISSTSSSSSSSINSTTLSSSQSYTTASAAAAAFQVSNKRTRQHEEDILASLKKKRKEVSYLRLDAAGHYSTLPTSSDSTSSSMVENYDDKDGHYIIKPNESLTARYKIMRLLGQGTFGKVVECYDRVRRTFCAIKVIRAIPKYRDASKIEIRVLNTLKEHDPLNLNKCIHLLEWFDYRNHICMVFELLGQSVFDFLKSNQFKPFPSSHIQQFAKQLLTSVAFLHDLKLIHTDLKPENILLVNPVSHYGVNGNKSSLILEDTDIRLIDFGSATFEQDYHSTVVSTRHYRAPEIILGMGWSYPCDVWSIGCILVEFFTGDALFHTHDNLEHLAMMEAVIGKVPPHITHLASREGQKFFKDNKLKYPDTKTTRQSRQFVRNMKPISQLISPTTTLNAHFMDLIQKMLVYDPNTRISAREALRHAFFTA
ncbi:CMGC/CLK protein kinase [Halteromyces radiatus]|uniref:CMGC/CLK protein kinase n=1 Tax=Halteromyces radiatus TaxID=101107 RepID=UPI002220D96F|nr:CMGC/CLK protein kinase [Halteromyces radiatus]KAI8086306.1 CMGC/CLK protein kinase [Halteromyces radiatus]